MYQGNLTKGTKLSAGYDLSAITAGIIEPGKRQLVSTGIYLNLNVGTFGLIKSRSGLSCRGIDVGAGVIDSDYRGEVKVLLCNNGEVPFEFVAGDRIAQLIIMPHLKLKSAEIHSGFGSTGK